jgi:hypothetical protein
MANELQTYRNSSVGAEESLFFLEVPTDPSTPDTKAYHMAFLRQEASSVDTGVETETIADVTQKVQPTEVKSYSPTQSFSGLFLKDDPVCKALEKVWRERATGASAHFNHLEVLTWNGNKAYRTDVTVSVSSLTNEAGDKRKIEGSFGYSGDSVEGTAEINAETGVATFTEASEG